MVKLIDKLVGFDEDADGTLAIGHFQHIPNEHVARLLRDKIDPDHAPTGDMLRVASVPVIVVERWKKDGFHIEQESAKAIVNRLKAEGLDAFVTTNKAI